MALSSRTGLFILPLIVVVVAFFAGVGVSRYNQSAQDPVEGLLWPDPPVLKDFALTDHTGAMLSSARLRGRWSLIFFGFTHCPDVCPTALEAMSAAQQSLRQEPQFGQTGQTIFISVDPERDSTETLANYVGYFSPAMIGATGSVDELKALTSSLGVLFMKIPGEGAEYTVDHSAGVFFISPDLQLLSVLTPPITKTALLERFETVSRFYSTHL